MFGPLGGPELLLVFVIALIVFGPRKLPEIGKSLGKMMAEFRRASNDLKQTIEDEVEAERLRELTTSYGASTPPGAPAAQPAPSSSTPLAPAEAAPTTATEPAEPAPGPALPINPPPTDQR
jgi:Tat protein translocase TatB subunit